MKEIFSLLEHLVQLCTVFVSRILALRRKHKNGGSVHHNKIRKEDNLDEEN